MTKSSANFISRMHAAKNVGCVLSHRSNFFPHTQCIKENISCELSHRQKLFLARLVFTKKPLKNLEFFRDG
jgi:hypothetical protein